MALNNKALQVEKGNGSYSLGPGTTAHFRCASYITSDAPAVVEAAGYFDLAASRLPKNTVLEVVMSAAGVPIYKEYVVTVNTGTAVTIVLQKTVAG